MHPPPLSPDRRQKDVGQEAEHDPMATDDIVVELAPFAGEIDGPVPLVADEPRIRQLAQRGGYARLAYPEFLAHLGDSYAVAGFRPLSARLKIVLYA